MKSLFFTLLGRLPVLLAVGVGLTIGTATRTVQAITLVDSSGFEAPDFNAGNLAGQQLWQTAGTGASTAVVQSVITQSGGQAIQVNRTSLSDRSWAKQTLALPSGRYTSIEWDMLVNPTDAATGFGPFFGVSVLDNFSGSVAAVASLGVDATTGEVLIQEGGTGFLIVTSALATNGGWDHFRIELDFQTDSYNVYLNGTLISSTGFIDVSLGIDRITEADITGFAAGGDATSQSQAGTAFFDNFVVRDGLRGDYNNNGVVDAADYTVWRDQLGQTAFGLAADGNSDGVVDGEDYLLWNNTFGDSNATASTAVAVPEPGGLLVVTILALGATLFRRP